MNPIESLINRMLDAGWIESVDALPGMGTIKPTEDGYKALYVLKQLFDGLGPDVTPEEIAALHRIVTSADWVDPEQN